MARVLVGVYLALVLALLAAAACIWRLRCEGFGCMGIGVAWFAWAGAFLVVLGVGVWVRASVAAATGAGRLGRAGWWVQLALGAALVVTWVALQQRAAQAGLSATATGEPGKCGSTQRNRTLGQGLPGRPLTGKTPLPLHGSPH